MCALTRTLRNGPGNRGCALGLGGQRSNVRAPKKTGGGEYAGGFLGCKTPNSTDLPKNTKLDTITRGGVL